MNLAKKLRAVTVGDSGGNPCCAGAQPILVGMLVMFSVPTYTKG